MRAVIGNSAWLFLDKGIGFLVAFFVSAIVARFLGPAGLGSYSLATAVSGQLLVLATLGIDQIIVRELARNPGQSGVISGTVLILRSVGGAFALALALPVAWLLSGGDRSVVICTVLATVAGVIQAANIPSCWFQAKLQSKFSVISGNVGTAIYVFGALGLVYAGAPLYAFFLVAIARSTAAVAIGFLMFQRQTGALSSFKWDRKFASSLGRDGWPALGLQAAVTVYMRSDQILLGHYRSQRELGQYAVAVRLGELFAFMAVAICASALPPLLQARSTDQVLYESRLIALFRALNLSGLVLCLGTTLAAPWIVRGVFGTQYDEAIPLLRIYVWSTFFIFLGVGATQWFLAENKMRILFAATVVGAVVSVAVNIALVPAYGAYGSTWASIVSYAVSGLFINALIPAARPVFVLQARSLAPKLIARMASMKSRT